MPRPLKRKILGASTIILSKDIDKYTSMCGLNFYEPDINKLEQLEFKYWDLETCRKSQDIYFTQSLTQKKSHQINTYYVSDKARNQKFGKPWDENRKF